MKKHKGKYKMKHSIGDVVVVDEQYLTVVVDQKPGQNKTNSFYKVSYIDSGKQETIGAVKVRPATKLDFTEEIDHIDSYAFSCRNDMRYFENKEEHEKADNARFMLDKLLHFRYNLMNVYEKFVNNQPVVLGGKNDK